MENTNLSDPGIVLDISFNENQQNLYNYMSNLCNEAHCMNWVPGWDVELWRALKRDKKIIRLLDFNDDVKSILKELETITGGWIVSGLELDLESRYSGFVFLPLDEYKKLK